MAESMHLLFNIEIREDTTDAPRSATDDLVALADHISFLAAPRNIYESRLLCDVRQFKAAVLVEEGRSDIVVLATKLAAVGYHVAIRTALGGGSGQECFRNLHHEFLVIAHDGEDLLIEPHFRAQFCISNTTADYMDLVKALPEEWVGSQSRIKPLVRLLCGQMALAFDATQTAFPPWRQQKSVISKWLPAKKLDRDISLAVSSPRAGSSPTSTLTSPDYSSPSYLQLQTSSPTSPSALTHKPWNFFSAQNPISHANTTWNIPSAFPPQQPWQQDTQEHITPQQDGSTHASQRTPPSKQAELAASLPKSMQRSVSIGPKGATSSLEPHHSTQGFEIRQKLGRSRSDVASSRGQSDVSILQDRLPGATLQRVPSGGVTQQLKPQPKPRQVSPIREQLRERERSQSLAPDLGAVRRASVLSRNRYEAWQQPRIHTVKLGQVQPALAH